MALRKRWCSCGGCQCHSVYGGCLPLQRSHIVTRHRSVTQVLSCIAPPPPLPFCSYPLSLGLIAAQNFGFCFVAENAHTVLLMTPYAAAVVLVLLLSLLSVLLLSSVVSFKCNCPSPPLPPPTPSPSAGLVLPPSVSYAILTPNPCQGVDTLLSNVSRHDWPEGRAEGEGGPSRRGVGGASACEWPSRSSNGQALLK